MSSVVIPMPKIHETAIIHPNAVLGKNVEIGPYAVIDEEVVIGDNCKIGAHAVIHKYTTVGKNCKFFPGCSIGADPQDLKFEDEKTSTVIGDGCVFRECTTVNRATVEGNKITVTAQPNTGTSAIKQTLTISLTNGNSKTVPVSVAAQGSGNETVISLDLSNTANYPQDFPIAKAQMKSDPITFTFGGYEYTFAGGEDAGTGYYQAESSGSVYTLIGKFGAYIELPAIAGKKLTKVVASTREGASKNVDVAIVDNEFTEVAGGEAVKWAHP